MALPLSSILFRGGKHLQPQCPPRLDLQVLETDQWSRVPVSSSKVHTLKLSDIRGWSMLCEEPGEGEREGGREREMEVEREEGGRGGDRSVVKCTGVL